jgi:hypothetical protein
MHNLFTFLLLAAQTGSPEMADALREDGKIWVVIGVMALIFIALAVYLFLLDRKVKKLEDKINDRTRS